VMSLFEYLHYRVDRGAALSRLLGLALACLSIAGCADSESDASSKALRLAVTTSTRDSGLLDVLIPFFEEEHSVRVDVIAIGTGAALKQGKNGNVDVVFVHSRKAEDSFMEAGHGIRREDVMYNTFELLGPSSDPAGIQGLPAAQALQKIAASRQRFVSRGDDSGTHKRELELWEAGGGRPEWIEYVESGQGMGGTLTMADQMQAYTLTDRGTYLKRSSTLDLAPRASQSEQLRNPYGIMVVDPKKHESIQGELANAFVDYIISREAQEMINAYQIDGESLFYSLRLPEDG